MLPVVVNSIIGVPVILVTLGFMFGSQERSSHFTLICVDYFLYLLFCLRFVLFIVLAFGHPEAFASKLFNNSNKITFSFIFMCCIFFY